LAEHCVPYLASGVALAAPESTNTRPVFIFMAGFDHQFGGFDHSFSDCWRLVCIGRASLGGRALVRAIPSAVCYHQCSRVDGLAVAV